MTNYIFLQCFNLLVLKSPAVNTQCDTEKTKHPLKLSAKDTQSNGWPFKFLAFCRIHWALNSGSKVLGILKFIPALFTFHINHQWCISSIYDFPFIHLCKTSTATSDTQTLTVRYTVPFVLINQTLLEWRTAAITTVTP